MTTEEVAEKLVKLCKEGKNLEAIDELYAHDVVSVEAFAPPGQSAETKGLAGVKAKSESWVANHEVHSHVVEGPLVAGVHFAVAFKYDVTAKSMDNRRMQIHEIGVYKVANGKIVHEQFFYHV